METPRKSLAEAVVLDLVHDNRDLLAAALRGHASQQRAVAQGMTERLRAFDPAALDAMAPADDPAWADFKALQDTRDQALDAAAKATALASEMCRLSALIQEREAVAAARRAELVGQ